MPHRTPHILLTALALLLACPPTPGLALERAPTPMHQLLQAPYQLEVTTLSVETKQGPHSGDSIWCRVRIDRVLAGPGLKAGDETAVVSVRYNNPPGTTGASGDWNIPAVGERRRLFANSTPSTLQPLPPNGWQPLTRAVHIDLPPTTARQPAPPDLIADNASLTTAYPHQAELIVLTNPMSDAALANGSLGHVAAALTARLPLVITGSALLSLADPPTNTPTNTPAAPRTPPTTPTTATLRAQAGLADPTVPPAQPPAHFTHLRILPPDPAAATHPILAGITIPPEGLLVPITLPTLPPPLPTATVLLYAEPATTDKTAPSGSAASTRQPILWVNATPRTTPRIP
ncbi:MAG: hypothetical protein IOD15_00145, partial [Phycisphaerales bacterium]|nr:hypothetical protein [Phycisphaerales bacterium]